MFSGRRGAHFHQRQSSDDLRLEHTTRSVGIVTKAMGLLKPGDQIGVRGPFGSHWPLNEENGRDFVIISGGIGLAPLRPSYIF